MLVVVVEVGVAANNISTIPTSVIATPAPTAGPSQTVELSAGL